MTAFATTDDLAARLDPQGGFTAGELTRAATLLDQASDLIRDAAGQTLSLVVGDEITRPGSPENRIQLPQRPVVEVTEVKIDGVTIDATGYYADGNELVRKHGLGISSPDTWGGWNSWGGWGGQRRTLTITYTHGYATIPGTIKSVCLEAVIRAWVNPGAVAQEMRGSESVTYQRAPGMLLTATEQTAVRELVRLQHGSMRLR